MWWLKITFYYYCILLFKTNFKFKYIHILPLPQILPDHLPVFTHPTLNY